MINLIFIVTFMFILGGSILSCFAKKDFITNTLYWGFAICLMYIASSQFLNNDYNAYRAYYNNALYNSNIEIGYRWLSIISKEYVNLSYDNFRMLIFIITFLIVAYSIKKLSKHYNFVLLMYFFLFFAVNITQIRYAIGESLIFLSFVFLKDKKLIGFLVCILLATSMHKSALFFFILLVLYFEKTREWVMKNKRIIVIGSIIMLVVFSVIKEAIPMVVNIIRAMDDSKSVMAQFEGYAGINYIKYLPIPFLQLVLFKLLNRENRMDDECVWYELLVYVTLVVYPFFTITRQLSRLSRTISLLTFIPFSNVFFRKNSKFEFKIIFIVYILFDFYAISGYTTCLEPLLNYSVFSILFAK